MNNLCKKSKVTKTIHGEDVNFYAIPMGTVFKFKHLSKKASGFLATLFADESKDVTVESYTGPSDQKDEKGDAYTQTQSTTKEISASLASLRAKQKADSVEGFVDSLFADDAQELLVEIIIKSASDTFTDADAADLLENMDSGSFAQYLFGAFEASKEGFAGLGKSLSLLGNFGKIKEAVAVGTDALKKVTE